MGEDATEDSAADSTAEAIWRNAQSTYRRQEGTEGMGRGLKVLTADSVAEGDASTTEDEAAGAAGTAATPSAVTVKYTETREKISKSSNRC